MTEENLRRVDIAVGCDSKEQQEHNYVQPIVGPCIIVVQNQKLAIPIILDALEVHCWLPIRRVLLIFASALRSVG